MEENKYICPQCGSEMATSYEKPALNLLCPKCGCKIATTKWDDIDLDDTEYKIILKPNKSPNIEQIKTISKITGLNFIQSSNILSEGGVIANCKSTEVKGITNKLNKDNISFDISPLFPW